MIQAIENETEFYSHIDDLQLTEEQPMIDSSLLNADGSIDSELAYLISSYTTEEEL